RDAQSKGSINKTGHFQTDLTGLAVEVKDSRRNPDKCAYYGFDADGQTAEAMPKGNGCYACHDAHAAVEHTFVQFYPTLKPVAKKFGVYKQAAEAIPPEPTAKPHGAATSTWTGILHTPERSAQRVILHVYGSGNDLTATADSP